TTALGSSGERLLRPRSSPERTWRTGGRSSPAREGIDEPAQPRRPAAALLAAVGPAVEGVDAVDRPPAQGLGLPRPRRAPDPWQRGELAGLAEDEIAQGPPGEVCGGDALADVAAGPGEPRP